MGLMSEEEFLVVEEECACTPGLLHGLPRPPVLARVFACVLYWIGKKRKRKRKKKKSGKVEEEKEIGDLEWRARPA